MTSKQEALVRHYLTTRNPRSSALFAGYSKSRLGNTVHELMANPKVRAAIEEGTMQAGDPAPMNETWIWAKLEYLIQMNIDRRPQIALKTIELAGRKHKMWVEHVEVDNLSGHAEWINRIHKRVGGPGKRSRRLRPGGHRSRTKSALIRMPTDPWVEKRLLRKSASTDPWTGTSKLSSQGRSHSSDIPPRLRPRCLSLGRGRIIKIGRTTKLAGGSSRIHQPALAKPCDKIHPMPNCDQQRSWHR